ncbi:MAG: hypothetical protein SchgKO_25070 [Schleiferiaceae bacterium]
MKKVFFALSALALFACSDDDDTNTPGTPDKYGSGTYIANEGVFQTGAGTVSYYQPEAKTVVNEVFIQENGFPVGNVLQDIGFNGENAFLVVNNSGTMEVVEAGTFKSKNSVTGFTSPRYFTVVSSQNAYVSDWFADDVKVIDLTSFRIVDSISTGVGPEKMISNGAGITYVANSGAWTRDSVVTVINSNDHEVLKTVQVGDNPQSLQYDENGNPWVLCSGYADWTTPANSTAGELIMLDPTTHEPAKTLVFPDNFNHPIHLHVYGSNLFYLSTNYGGKVMKMDASSTTLPTTPLIDKGFYNFSVDPSNGDIYGTDAKDFNQTGMVYRYDMNGSLLDSFATGIIPSTISFK